VVSTGVWMLAYLLLPRVKQAFSAAARVTGSLLSSSSKVTAVPNAANL
jgi:hypothetical protein